MIWQLGLLGYSRAKLNKPSHGPRDAQSLGNAGGRGAPGLGALALGVGGWAGFHTGTNLDRSSLSRRSRLLTFRMEMVIAPQRVVGRRLGRGLTYPRARWAAGMVLVERSDDVTVL